MNDSAYFCGKFLLIEQCASLHSGASVSFLQGLVSHSSWTTPYKITALNHVIVEWCILTITVVCQMN